MPNSSIAREIVHLLAIAVLILVVVVQTSAKVARTNSIQSLRNQAENRLTVYSNNLSSELDKYRSLPLMHAKHPLLADTLLYPGKRPIVQAANELLAGFNATSGALDTYIIDIKGVTLAASNWYLNDTFIGEDLSFRPYFSDAVNEGTGYYFALGSTSRKRGYYFSAAIRDYRGATISNPGPVIGVVVVKVNLEQMEKTWSQVRDTVIVTDEDGVIFISSRPDWVYRTLHRLPPEQLASIKASRRYADNPLVPLELTSVESHNKTDRLLSIAIGDEKARRTVLQQSRSVPEKGWVIHIFSDYNVVVNNISERAVAAGSTAALFLALLAIVFIRRDIKRRAYREMELQVQARTDELAAAQDNLVQATKMVALGQMATSLSHELSQPMSAIRAYSENAQEFIRRGKIDNASDNLDLIVKMGERMSAIMHNLKTFARKTTFQPKAVSLHNIISETLTMMKPAVDEAGADIDYEPIPAELTVRAEPVRLQQVFTNLIHNAIDATKNTEQKKIMISAKLQQDTVLVAVADTGAGIDESIRDNLFEPFSTTKKSGEGLGLGLSLSYDLVREFGGNIVAAEAPGNGAVFTVELKMPDTPDGATAR